MPMKVVLWLLAMIVTLGGAAAAPYDVTEKSIATLQADLATGHVTSEELVRAYLGRIETLDRNGPSLHSVIAVNPNALADARALDGERKTKGSRGPLHGIPILVKDNIETADDMATTAGSLALADNITRRDSPSVARLRAAGVIILGKANLSEWANIRSSHSISGWSAIGGLVKNPYVLDRSACGSSSGSGAAVAASLAAAALGTETDGSLVCPGSLNGVVALKPTVGLVSRTHVIPISHSQDTPGPMARTIADAALLLSVMAGSDKDDPSTSGADDHKTDYVAALEATSLRGKRLGMIMPVPDSTPSDTDAVFAKAVAALKAAGAEIVEIRNFVPPPPEAGTSELKVLQFELKHDLNAYLAGLPSTQKAQTLADIIAFNNATPRETLLFGQDIFEKAQESADLSDLNYIKARDDLRKLARDTLDRLFTENNLDALIRSTDDAAFRIDVVKGDNDTSNSSFLPATAAYPHLTVPMGDTQGLPVGISFIGPAWSEAKLLALGYAFEQATQARQPPQYLPSLESSPGVARAFKPMSR